MSKIMELGVQLSCIMSGSFNTQFTKASRLIGELQRKTAGMQKQFGDIGAYKKASQGLNDLVSKLNADGWQDKKLLSQYEQQERAVEKLKSKLQSAGIDVSRLAQHESRLASELERSSNAMKRLENAQLRVNELRAKLDWGNVKGEFMKSAAMLKTFEVPVKVNMEFEQQMANVKAVLDPTQEEFAALKTQAMELGSKTQFSAIQAGQAQENLSRAGFKTPQILEMMPQILNMAAADGMAIDQAATILTRTLRQFNAPVTEAKRYTDLMAYTSASSNTDIARLGDALIKFAPTARAYNVAPEKALAMLGSIANSVQEGESGGLALTRVLETLSSYGKVFTMGMGKGSDKKSAEFGKIKLVLMNDKGQLRELPDILKDLHSQIKDKGAGEQGAIMKAIFGRFSTPMNAMMTQVLSGEYDQIEQGAYTKSNNKAANMALTRNDTLQGDITALSSAWEGFMIRVGKPLEDWSRVIVQGITKALNTVNELITNHGQLVDYIVKVGAAYAGWKIGSTAFDFIKNLMALPGALRELRNAQAAVDVINSAGTASATAAGGVGAMSGAMNLLWLKVMLVVGAIELLIKYWDQIKALPGMIDNVMKSAEAKQAFGSRDTSKANPDRHVAAMNQFGGPSWMFESKRALGGMITRPEIALIGEAGPEAVIPLSTGKRSRGLQVLDQAAQLLGVRVVSPEMQNIAQSSINNTVMNDMTRNANTSMQTLGITGAGGSELLSTNITNNANNNQGGDMLSQSESLFQTGSSITNENKSSYSRVMNPVINITLNGLGSSQQEGQTLAQDIYSRVKEALSELMNDSDRLSYA